MPEATSPKDVDTSADTENGGAQNYAPAPPDPYFYNCALVPEPLSTIMVWAISAHRGAARVNGDQLPPAPDDREDMAARSQWWADLHTALGRLGVLDAWRAHLAGTAYAVQCPWWCVGQHPMLVDGHLGAVIHATMPVAGVDFSNKPDLHKEVKWQLRITQWEGPVSDDEFEFGPVCIDGAPSPDLPEQMDLEDVECVANAYRRAADRLAEIVAITESMTTSEAAA